MGPVSSGLRRARRSVLVQNALALYAVQGASFLLPLVTLPYLARVLRPEGWGLVVFSQALALWLSLILHYGFAFSATRAVAQHREDPERLAGIVAGVQGAKLLLLGGVVAVGLLAGLLVPTFRAHPEYLAWAWVTAVVQGFNPLWYFQGVERLRQPAVLDVSVKVLATAGVFLWVRSPADGWAVLALRAAAELASTSVMTWWLYRSVPRRGFRWGGALATLRDGWPLFVFSSAASIYTTANSFLLGLLALPREVSFYGSGERVVRAVSTLLGPLSQALYPRVSHLTQVDRARAGALLRRSLVPFVGMGLLMGISLFAFAPLLTRVVFGAGYEPVVGVIRVLAIIPVLLGIGTVLGIQWALPMGMDRVYNRFVIGAGALNVALAVLLVPRFGALGMAWSAVAAEASVEAGLIWLAVRHGALSRPESTRLQGPLAGAEPLLGALGPGNRLEQDD